MDKFISQNMMFLAAMTAFTIADSKSSAAINEAWEGYDVAISTDVAWCFAGVLVLIWVNASWVRETTRVYRQRRTPTLVPIEGKNWYQCHFGAPYFLPAKEPGASRESASDEEEPSGGCSMGCAKSHQAGRRW